MVPDVQCDVATCTAPQSPASATFPWNILFGIVSCFGLLCWLIYFGKKMAEHEPKIASAPDVAGLNKNEKFCASLPFTK